MKKLNPNYVRQIESVNFTKTDVTCVFKNAPTYIGPIEGLGEHIKEHDSSKNAVAFKESFDSKGNRVGVFCVFNPTTKRQRKVMQDLGVELEDGQGFSFATRQGAGSVFRAMTEAKVKVAASNFKWGVIAR